MEIDKSGRIVEKYMDTAYEKRRASSAEFAVGSKKFRNDEAPLLTDGKPARPCRHRKRLILTTCALALFSRGDIGKVFNIGALCEKRLSKAGIPFHIIWIIPALALSAIRLGASPLNDVKMLVDASIAIILYMSRHLRAAIATELSLVALAYACLLLLRCLSKLDDRSNEDAIDLFFQEMVETWDANNTSHVLTEGCEALDVMS